MGVNGVPMSGGSVLVLGGEGAAEDSEAFWDGSVVDPSASLLAVDQASLAQHFEVVADGWLGDAEWFDEVACRACFGGGADEAEQAEPGRVGEDTVPLGQSGSFVGGEGFIEKGGAAFDDGVHGVILP
jgi:hypothetical protein